MRKKITVVIVGESSFDERAAWRVSREKETERIETDTASGSREAGTHVVKHLDGIGAASSGGL